MSDISRHICYLLNVGGMFCFSMPEDLTIKYYLCIFMIVRFLYFCREIQETPARSCLCARHETAPLKHWGVGQAFMGLGQFRAGVSPAYGKWVKLRRGGSSFRRA